MGISGTPLSEPITVQVLDFAGSPIAGLEVTWSTPSAGSAVSPAKTFTDANGRAASLWTLGAGAFQSATAMIDEWHPVVFSARAHDASTPLGTIGAGCTAQPGPPAFVRLVSGGTQTGNAGTALADSIVVQVTDQYENPVNAVLVTWTAAGDSGSVNHTTTITNADGRAWTRWTLGPAVPLQAILAGISGTAPLRITATVH